MLPFNAINVPFLPPLPPLSLLFLSCRALPPALPPAMLNFTICFLCIALAAIVSAFRIYDDTEVWPHRELFPLPLLLSKKVEIFEQPVAATFGLRALLHRGHLRAIGQRNGCRFYEDFDEHAVSEFVRSSHQIGRVAFELKIIHAAQLLKCQFVASLQLKSCSMDCTTISSSSSSSFSPCPRASGVSLHVCI